MLGPDCIGLVVSGEKSFFYYYHHFFLLNFLPFSPSFLLLHCSGKVKYFFSNNQAELEDWVAVITNAIDFNQRQLATSNPASPTRTTSTHQAGVKRRASRNNSIRRYSGTEDDDLGMDGAVMPSGPDPTLAEDDEDQTIRREIVEVRANDQEEEVTVFARRPLPPPSSHEGEEEKTLVKGRVEVVTREAVESPVSPGNDKNEDGDSDGEEIPELPKLEPPPAGKVLSFVVRPALPAFDPVAFPGEREEIADHQQQGQEHPVITVSVDDADAGESEGRANVEGGEEAVDRSMWELPIQIPESIRRSLMLDRGVNLDDQGQNVAVKQEEKGEAEERKQEEEEANPAAASEKSVGREGEVDPATAEATHPPGSTATPSPSPPKPPRPQKPPRASPGQQVTSIRFISSEVTAPHHDHLAPVAAPRPTPVPAPRQRSPSKLPSSPAAVQAPEETGSPTRPVAAPRQRSNTTVLAAAAAPVVVVLPGEGQLGGE